VTTYRVEAVERGRNTGMAVEGNGESTLTVVDGRMR